MPAAAPIPGRTACLVRCRSSARECAGYSWSVRCRYRPFQLDLVAIGIVAVQRQPFAFGAIAFLGRFDFNPRSLQVGRKCSLIERLDAQAEMVQVAPFGPRRRAARLAQGTVQGHQIDHCRARGQVDHAQVFAHTADRAAEQLGVEGDAALQVADAQNEVVDVLDGERSHAKAPCGRWIPVEARPALWAALSRRELDSQAIQLPCGSGFSREEPHAVQGTGCAGVRS
ncbi:protein of unknown function [Pseudomonas sp. JV551A1]|nr:protein of unknown function [Pseudomonas sp. JV551A1]